MLWVRLWMLGRGVLVSRRSQGPLSSNGGMKFFRSIINFFPRILNALSSPLRVQGSQYVLVL
jgi:hypothetical protein